MKVTINNSINMKLNNNLESSKSELEKLLNQLNDDDNPFN